MYISCLVTIAQALLSLGSCVSCPKILYNYIFSYDTNNRSLLDSTKWKLIEDQL